MHSLDEKNAEDGRVGGERERGVIKRVVHSQIDECYIQTPTSHAHQTLDAYQQPVLDVYKQVLSTKAKEIKCLPEQSSSTVSPSPRQGPRAQTPRTASRGQTSLGSSARAGEAWKRPTAAADSVASERRETGNGPGRWAFTVRLCRLNQTGIPLARQSQTPPTDSSVGVVSFPDFRLGPRLPQ